MNTSSEPLIQSVRVASSQIVAFQFARSGVPLAVDLIEEERARLAYHRTRTGHKDRFRVKGAARAAIVASTRRAAGYRDASRRHRARLSDRPGSLIARNGVMLSCP